MNELSDDRKEHRKHKKITCVNLCNTVSKISIFRNVKYTKPAGVCTIQDFFVNVINGDMKAEITAIRKEKDIEKRKELKKLLPALTISGTFSERKKEGLIKHSGFICLDIDGKDNPNVNMNEMRGILGTWKEILFSSLSASGKGVFVIIPIAYPDKHVAQFKALQQDFKTQGINIDNGCSDVSRLRFMSYDPDAIYNGKAELYNRVFKERPRYHLSQVKRTYNLEDTIQNIILEGIDITNSYKNWYEVGAAIANEYGESGRNYFHQLSCLHAEYSSVNCDKQFNHCLRNPGRYSGATIFYYAKKFLITI